MVATATSPRLGPNPNFSNVADSGLGTRKWRWGCDNMQTGALSLESTKLSSRGRTLVEQLKETLAKPPTPSLHAHSAKGGTLPPKLAPMPATPAPAPSKLPDWRSQDAKDKAAALEQAVKRAATSTPQFLADTTTAAPAATTAVKPPLPLPRSAPPAVAATSRPGTGASLASLVSDASGFVRHQMDVPWEPTVRDAPGPSTAQRRRARRKAKGYQHVNLPLPRSSTGRDGVPPRTPPLPVAARLPAGLVRAAGDWQPMPMPPLPEGWEHLHGVSKGYNPTFSKLVEPSPDFPHLNPILAPVAKPPGGMELYFRAKQHFPESRMATRGTDVLRGPGLLEDDAASTASAVPRAEWVRGAQVFKHAVASRPSTSASLASYAASRPATAVSAATDWRPGTAASACSVVSAVSSRAMSHAPHYESGDWVPMRPVRRTAVPTAADLEDDEYNRSLQDLKDIFYGERRAKQPLRTILGDLDVHKRGHLDAAAVTAALVRINPNFSPHALTKLLGGFAVDGDGGAGDAATGDGGGGGGDMVDAEEGVASASTRVDYTALCEALRQDRIRFRTPHGRRRAHPDPSNPFGPAAVGQPFAMQQDAARAVAEHAAAYRAKKKVLQDAFRQRDVGATGRVHKDTFMQTMRDLVAADPSLQLTDQDIQRLWKSARDEGTDTVAYDELLRDGIRPESALPDVPEFMKPKPARRSEPGRIWQWHNAVPEEVFGVDYGNRRSLP